MSNNDPAPDWAHLGLVVLQYRERRGWSQADVASRGGPSDTTQTDIELGRWRSARPHRTLGKIDEGLRWRAGTAAKVLFEGARVDLTHGSMPVVVGGVADDLPGYVRGPGEKVEGGASDDAVLRAIQQMQEDLRAMSERLARLEGDGS